MKKKENAHGRKSISYIPLTNRENIVFLQGQLQMQYFHDCKLSSVELD